jgi:hypothetical protein
MAGQRRRAGQHGNTAGYFLNFVSDPTLKSESNTQFEKQQVCSRLPRHNAVAATPFGG